MSFLSSFPRDALRIPDTRIPVDPTTFVSYILPPVVCFFAAATLAVTPQTRAVQIALWPITVYLAIRAPLSVDLSTGRFDRQFLNVDLALFMLTTTLRTLDWALAKGPQRRISSPSNSSPSTFKDALSLLANLRGHGWEWSRGSYVPPETRPTSRIPFAVYTCLSAFAHALFCGALQRALLTVTPTGIGSIPQGSTLFDDTLPVPVRYFRSSLLATLVAFSVYAVMQMGYDLATLSAVLLLGHDPRDWPPMFQAPWCSTSLSDFWARRWHQLFRGPFLLVSRPFTAVLGPAGTVLGAFLASAVLHHVTMIVLNPEMEFWWMYIGFGMMAPGVLVERGWYRVTGCRVGGVGGWMWTMAWLVMWGNVLAEGFARAGLFRCASEVDMMLPVRIPVEHAMEALDLWLHTI